MISDIFSNLEGLYGEDYSSEIFNTLLRNNSVSQAFVEYIFRCFNITCAYDMNTSIKTQETIKNIGRLDFSIVATRYKIVIENKFYAPFTNNDQLKRYYDYLSNDNSEFRILILLTIQQKVNAYKYELISMFGLSSVANDDIESEISIAGVHFKVLAWEDVLNSIPESFLVKQFKIYIKNRFSIDATLTDREMEIMLHEDIPSILQKIWSAVDLTKDDLRLKYNVGRTSQSMKYYGFSIGVERQIVWVGYAHNIWLETKMPYVVQVNVEKNDKNANKLINDGFVYDDQLGYCYYIKGEEKNLHQELYRKVIKILEKIPSVYLK